jgi:hypothetical protein
MSGSAGESFVKSGFAVTARAAATISSVASAGEAAFGQETFSSIASTSSPSSTAQSAA